MSTVDANFLKNPFSGIRTGDFLRHPRVVAIKNTGIMPEKFRYWHNHLRTQLKMAETQEDKTEIRKALEEINAFQSQSINMSRYLLVAAPMNSDGAGSGSVQSSLSSSADSELDSKKHDHPILKRTRRIIKAAKQKLAKQEEEKEMTLIRQETAANIARRKLAEQDIEYQIAGRKLAEQQTDLLKQQADLLKQQVELLKQEKRRCEEQDTEYKITERTAQEMACLDQKLEPLKQESAKLKLLEQELNQKIAQVAEERQKIIQAAAKRKLTKEEIMRFKEVLDQMRAIQNQDQDLMSPQKRIKLSVT